MFDTLVLLSGLGEQDALVGALQEHRPDLTVLRATTIDDLNGFAAADRLDRARLVAFSTRVIVPTTLLGRFGFGAYNFHPGPPSYPGLAPAQFAVYQGSALFGVTAHVMTSRVDTGPIVDVELFFVEPGTGVAQLQLTAFGLLARLFARLARHLATDPQPLPELPIIWGTKKSTLRMLRDHCRIEPDMSRDELARRIAAFGNGQFGVVPTIELHGHRFQLVTSQQEPAG